ncbi:AbiJ-NTD4 domain-containing protein [Pseudomonas sp. SDO528_S397]|nr:hypothetical protein [Pseudomonas alliivorans]MEE4649324.1 hypothetical protein [Pseudomonas alliivorans]
MRETFSKRHGFSNTEEANITVREDAPSDMRSFFIQLCYDCGLTPTSLRAMVCKALKRQPNRDNWSDYPNVANEVEDLLDECKWFKVYDIIERLHDYFTEQRFDRDVYDHFVTELNDYFIEFGIGWKLVDGRFETRGPESFEVVVKSAKETEQLAGHTTASNELHQAIADLSRRPHPDPTGAIQHAMASLECVARQVTGDVKANLGEILKRHNTLIPAPLDQAVARAWGYASENGRHLREGREPSYTEAELIVGLCASLSNYLIKKTQSQTLDGSSEPLF